MKNDSTGKCNRTTQLVPPTSFLPEGTVLCKLGFLLYGILWSLHSCFFFLSGKEEQKKKKKIHKHLFLWEEELQRKLLSGRHLSIDSLKLPPYYWPYFKKKRIKTRKAFMSYM